MVDFDTFISHRFGWSAKNRCFAVYRLTSPCLPQGRISSGTCTSSPPNPDDVIKWKHFSRYWPFVRGILQSPVNSAHKGQWRGALMFSLICAWITGWGNNREAGDLRRHCPQYDVSVMDVLIGTVIYAITGLVNCLSHIRYLAICDVSLIATLEMNYIKCEAKHKLMYLKTSFFLLSFIFIQVLVCLINYTWTMAAEWLMASKVALI